MFRKYALFAVLIPFVFSSYHTFAQDNQIESEWTLLKSDSLVLPFYGNPEHSVHSERFVIGKDGIEYFTFVPSTEDAVLFCNINEENPILHKVIIQDPDSLDLKFEVVNGYSRGSMNKMEGHFFASPDSIYVFYSSKLMLYDGSGNLINRYQLARNIETLDSLEKSLEYFPMGKGYHMNKFGDQFYFTTDGSFKSSYDYQPSIIHYNLSTNHKTLIAPFSQPYKEGQWGLWWWYLANLAPSSDGKGIVVNFPADPFLYKYDGEGNPQDSFLVKSELFEVPPPFHPDPSYNINLPQTYSEALEFSISTSSYRELLYDPYKKVYYRITFLRPGELESFEGRPIPDFSVIVCDENFEVLTERKFFSKDYDLSFFAVSSRGFALTPKQMQYRVNRKMKIDFFTLIQD